MKELIASNVWQDFKGCNPQFNYEMSELEILSDRPEVITDEMISYLDEIGFITSTFKPSLLNADFFDKIKQIERANAEFDFKYEWQLFELYLDFDKLVRLTQEHSATRAQEMKEKSAKEWFKEIYMDVVNNPQTFMYQNYYDAATKRTGDTNHSLIMLFDHKIIAPFPVLNHENPEIDYEVAAQGNVLTHGGNYNTAINPEEIIDITDYFNGPCLFTLTPDNSLSENPESQLEQFKDAVNHEIIGHGILGLDDHNNATECIMQGYRENTYKKKILICLDCEKNLNEQNPFF